MRSRLYRGWVRHRRDRPAVNHFRYPLFMLGLDLDELDRVFAGRWLWSTRRPAPARFRRRDYLGDPSLPLKQSVLDEVQKQTGLRPAGPVELLTHLRYFGYGFNPVSFYFCHDTDGRNIEAIIAEITNTPWGEKYPYVLRCEPLQQGNHRFEFSKQFHISPFMAMDQHYAWRFALNGRYRVIHMENFENGQSLFDATLVLKPQTITGPALAQVLIEYPFMTGQVIAGIYWQALKLWWKGSPVYPHPGRSVQTKEYRHE